MMQIKLHAVTRDEQMTRNLPRVRTCHDCKQTVLLALRHSGKQMRPLDAEEVEKLRRSEKAVDGGQDARRWCGTEDDAMDELSRCDSPVMLLDSSVMEAAYSRRPSQAVKSPTGPASRRLQKSPVGANQEPDAEPDAKARCSPTRARRSIARAKPSPLQSIRRVSNLDSECI